ncbi:MAG: arginine repressor [Lachnospiraceae bacterium]|nr:arginine repressor [Lachnospiraceae bacterium]
MKSTRQSIILDLISKNDIETQEELLELLKKSGYNVTQATISRDIRELKLTKISTEYGRQKYAVMMDQGSRDISDKYIRIFHDALVSVDTAGNILVLKTVAGMAMAVAAAIDAMHFEGVVGCIAGDDTIFCAVKTEAETIKLSDKIHKLTANQKV